MPAREPLRRDRTERCALEVRVVDEVDRFLDVRDECEEPYKSSWAGETRQLERVELFPPHFSGRLHRRTVDAERSIKMLARRIFLRKPCDSNVPPVGAAS